MINQPFVIKDEITKDIEDSIIKSCISYQRKHFSTSFSPDRITECPRRLVYESTNQHKEDKYVELDDNITCIKSKWIDRLNRIKNIEIVQQNMLVCDANYSITSIVDCVVRYKDDGLFIVNIQPVSENDFLTITKNGALRKHIISVIVKMWLAEIKDGILICENKDDNKFVVFHVKDYKPVIESVKKKCRLMAEYKLKSSLPDKPYENNNEGECRECEFSKECWKK